MYKKAKGDGKNAKLNVDKLYIDGKLVVIYDTEEMKQDE